jgi:hypothetical protein
VNPQEPLEAPYVRAVVVPGSQPDTEAVDVLIAWHDLDQIAATARRVLPQVHAMMTDEPRFGGEVTFVVATDFLDEPALEIGAAAAALEQELARVAGPHPTATGKALVVKVRVQSA